MSQSAREQVEVREPEARVDPWERVVESGPVSGRPCRYVTFDDGSAFFYGWQGNSRVVVYQPETTAHDAVSQITGEQESYMDLVATGARKEIYGETYLVADVEVDRTAYEQAKKAVDNMDFDKSSPTGVVVEAEPHESIGFPHNKPANSHPQDAFRHFFEDFVNPKEGRW
ncbi:MAG: hypothetical protein ABEI07_00640 [Candidatus Nanohaloarchaea archaeon]